MFSDEWYKQFCTTKKYCSTQKYKGAAADCKYSSLRLTAIFQVNLG